MSAELSKLQSEGVLIIIKARLNFINGLSGGSLEKPFARYAACERKLYRRLWAATIILYRGRAAFGRSPPCTPAQKSGGAL
jgi:hypothetical protein